MKSAESLPEEINIRPVKKLLKVKLRQGVKEEITIGYDNKSNYYLQSYFGHLLNVSPIILATSNPKDRKSRFFNDNWISPNRASSGFLDKDYKTPVDYVKNGQKFGFKLSIDSKGIKEGTYKESFSIVQEGLFWIEGSQVDLILEIY